jgi:AmiR/NasT family two-component response regulator
VSARVVIAEDEALIRLDLRETLEEEGYAVVAETGRGDEVVELVRQHRPDLVILDIKMPGEDGLSAAAAISAERFAAVLILTAFSQRELVDRAREAGALAYLVKPFQRSDLVPAIELALGRFEEMKALEEENKDLEERFNTHKLVERAKGVLMDELDMKENDAFRWVQRRAMDERATMKEIAQRVLDGELRPGAGAPAVTATEGPSGPATQAEGAQAEGV